MPTRKDGDLIVQSWDTASKTGALNDYSVCITALRRGREIYILNIFRGRLEFPDLVRKVRALAEAYRPDALLIEDAASGAQLIQHLREEGGPGVPMPIACRPEQDKVTRFAGQTPKIEAGEVVLPQSADWLACFENELLGFPKTRHDDQVDALTQILAWSQRHRPTPLLTVAGEKQVNWAKVQ